jgi:hypothetical protein
MKSDVIIENVMLVGRGQVKLTRAQVEAAMAELNKPDKRLLEPGEAFTHADGPLAAHYYMPLTTEQIAAVRLNIDSRYIPGIVFNERYPGGFKIDHYVTDTRTVIDGKLDGSPVVKGRVIFQPDKENL